MKATQFIQITGCQPLEILGKDWENKLKTLRGGSITIKN